MERGDLKSNSESGLDTPWDILNTSSILYHPHILNGVFAFAADIDPPGIRRKTTESGELQLWYSLGWIRVSHICRQWRLVALEMGQLWARIVCNIPAATNTCIARARHWPLTFVPWFEPDLIKSLTSYNDHHDLAARYLSRTRSLRCTVDRHLRIWPRILQETYLPLLCNLDLTVHTYHSEEARTLCLDAPLLSHAYVMGIPFMTFSPALRSLKLDQLPNPPELLLETLSRSPLLEDLALSLEAKGGTAFLAGCWSQTSISVVDLPSLLQLQLAIFDLSDGAAFLSLLRLPINTTLHINANCTPDKILRIIDAIQPQIFCEAYHNLQLSSDAISFEFILSAPVDSARTRFCNHITMAMPISALSSERYRIFSHLTRYLDTKSLKTLDLRRFSFRADVGYTCADIFRRLAFVSHVRVGQALPISDLLLVKPDATASAAHPGDNTPTMPFPELTEMTVIMNGALGFKAADALFSRWWNATNATLEARSWLCGPLAALALEGIWPSNKELSRRKNVDQESLVTARLWIAEIRDLRSVRGGRD